MKFYIPIRKILKYTIPGIIFYATLDMFFKSFGFSISAVVLLFLLSAASCVVMARYRNLAAIPGVLFAAGSVTFLLSIGQGPMQKEFMIFVSVLFVIMLAGLSRFFVQEEEKPHADRTKIADSGFNLNQTIIMFSVFFLSGGIYGIYIITDMPSWQLILVMFIGIYLSAYYLAKINFLESCELGLHLDYFKNRAFNFYSFLSAVLMIELVWVMTFLPINHLTFGAIVLSAFFSHWNIIRKHLRNELTRRDFMNNMIFLVATVSIILVTSRLYIN